MKKGVLFTFVTLLSVMIYPSLLAQSAETGIQKGKIHFKLKDKVPFQVPFEEGSLNVDIQQVNFLKTIAGYFNLTKLSRPYYDGKTPILDKIFLLEFAEDENNNIDLLKKALSSLDEVEYASKLHAHQSFFDPNDPSITTQQTYLTKIKAQLAWDVTKGNNIIVAIVDNAFNINHEEFSAAGKKWTNTLETPGNAKDDDNNGYVDDISGWDAADKDGVVTPPSSSGTWPHGSLVAGLAGAATNNGKGGASVGFNCKLMFIKAAENADATAAIKGHYGGVLYAARNGANVINMSYGSPNSADSVEVAILREARNRGCVLVAAAGNSNTEIKHYPAAYSEVIAVANVNSSDGKYTDSNYGTWVDISAPGENMYGPSSSSNTAYITRSGTSMAAPVVSGLCALMLSKNPALTHDQVKSCLQSSAVNINAQNPSFIGKLGAGRIDAQGAVNCGASLIKTFDASVTKIVSPAGVSCSGSITPTILLKNLGTTTLTSLTLTAKIDGDVVKTATWTGSLAWLKSLTIPYSFPAITNIAPGNHTLTITASQPNNQTDENSSNDVLTTNFSISPITALPYTNNFETDITGWAHNSVELIPNSNPNGSPKDMWTLGKPTKTKLNTVRSGTKAWTTGISGTYDYSNKSILQTPCFSLVGALNPKVSFWMIFDIEFQWDALFFEYSIDDGKTWTKLGSASDPNWYNNNKTGDNVNIGIHLTGAQWTGTNTTWTKYSHSLNSLTSQSQISFRFNFSADDATQQEGIVIDDFEITVDNIGVDNQHSNLESIAVYPNPSEGKITIGNLYEKENAVNIMIYNALGTLVKETLVKAPKGAVELDLSEQSNGIYFVKIITGDGSLTRKITLTR